MSDRATLDRVYEEILATRGEVVKLGERMAAMEARQSNTPTIAAHEVLASRLDMHERSCAETNRRLISIDEDFEHRLRSVEERAPQKAHQLGAAAGTGGVVVMIVEIVRHLFGLAG